MYQIRCGEYILSDVRDNTLTVYNARMTLEANTAGSLQFTIYPDHPCYSMLSRLSSVCTVLKDGKTVFKGRLIADKQVFNNSKNVTVEGKLAFLNDSIMRPFSFSGSPEEFFRQVIENHNSQVQPFQQFKIGTVTVKDTNDYIVRSSTEYLSTWEIVKSRLFGSTLGGYLVVRYEPDGDYLDYLEDFTENASQPIRFGSNLLDFSRDISGTETYTAILPRGAEVDGQRIGIASVNNGIDYLVDQERAKKYGVIFAPASASTWEDVTLPENLLKKAGESLAGTGIKLKETLELTAIDLNFTDIQINSFWVGQYIQVISELHGVRERYLLRKMDIDLFSPQNTRITLGESRLTLADLQVQNNQKNNTIQERINIIEQNYITEAGIEETVQAAAGEKVAEVMDGFISNNFVAGENIVLTVTEEKRLQISATVPEKGSGMYAFTIKADGCLYVGTEKAGTAKFRIDEAGCLIYTMEVQ